LEDIAKHLEKLDEELKKIQVEIIALE